MAKDWFTNYRMESRQLLYQEDFNYAYQRTDMSFIVGKRSGFSTKIAGGYQVILLDEELIHRFIQQFHLAKKYQNLKLNHRIQTDQTFVPNAENTYRLRYRLSSEIPLNGHTLDLKEMFLKVNHEYLNALSDVTYGLEIRLAAFLGYAFSSRSKFEIGIDNRLDQFVEDRSRNRFWLGINIYQSL